MRAELNHSNATDNDLNRNLQRVRKTVLVRDIITFAILIPKPIKKRISTWSKEATNQGHGSNVRARTARNSSSRRCQDDQSVTRTAYGYHKAGELTKRCILPNCSKNIKLREAGRGTTHLCRLLSQLKHPLVGELLFPFLPRLWRQIRAVLLERGLENPQALERQVREALTGRVKRDWLLGRTHQGKVY